MSDGCFLWRENESENFIVVDVVGRENERDLYLMATGFIVLCVFFNDDPINTIVILIVVHPSSKKVTQFHSLDKRN